MIKLSAAIICFNEEKRIRKTLESLQGVADEIIVVDSFSTDKTQAICEEFNVTFIQNPFEGHIEQKNFALEKCSHDYVLSLDADEALNDELKASILKVKENWQGSGYHFNRLTNYVDQWIYHSGWYPDKKLRLIKKGYAKWEGRNPHDILKLNDGSKSQYLKGDLLHYSYLSVSDHVRQTNKFTTIAAKACYEQGVRSSMFKVITRPWIKFVRDYFFKRGFLDGRYGFIICYITLYHHILV